MGSQYAVLHWLGRGSEGAGEMEQGHDKMERVKCEKHENVRECWEFGGRSR